MAWPTSKHELRRKVEELELMNKYGMLRPSDIERNNVLIRAYKKELGCDE